MGDPRWQAGARDARNAPPSVSAGLIIPRPRNFVSVTIR